MRKGFDTSAEFFIPVSRLVTGAGYAFREHAEEKQLRGLRLSRDQFIVRLTYHYDQVNYLHPFREGNGRTQRIFWSQIHPALTAPLAVCKFCIPIALYAINEGEIPGQTGLRESKGQHNSGTRQSRQVGVP